MPYLDKLMKLQAAHPERFRKGVITHVIVEHEDRCPALKGRECTCDCNITIRSDMEYRMGLRGKGRR